MNFPKMPLKPAAARVITIPVVEDYFFKTGTWPRVMSIINQKY